MTIELEDVEVLQRAHPRTFSIPRREQRYALSTGSVVKLIFRVPASFASRFGAERMWCEVTGRGGDRYRGRLLNQPSTEGWLTPGAEVEFEARHVASIEQPDRPPMAPLVGCALAVLHDGAWPSWLLRVAPTHERDSGWRVLASGGDQRVRGVTADGLCRAWAVVDSVLDERESGAWAWDEDALELRRSHGVPGDVLAAANRGLGRDHAPPPAAGPSAIVARRVLEQPPGVAQWDPPVRDDDCGWSFLVGDEPQAYLDDTSNFTAVPLGRILHLYPFVERVAGERTRGLWTWDDDLGDWGDRETLPDD